MYTKFDIPNQMYTELVYTNALFNVECSGKKAESIDQLIALTGT